VPGPDFLFGRIAIHMPAASGVPVTPAPWDGDVTPKLHRLAPVLIPPATDRICTTALNACSCGDSRSMMSRPAKIARPPGSLPARRGGTRWHADCGRIPVPLATFKEFTPQQDRRARWSVPRADDPFARGSAAPRSPAADLRKPRSPAGPLSFEPAFTEEREDTPNLDKEEESILTLFALVYESRLETAGMFTNRELFGRDVDELGLLAEGLSQNSGHPPTSQEMLQSQATKGGSIRPGAFDGP
jgi:hypothetical protein